MKLTARHCFLILIVIAIIVVLCLHNKMGHAAWMTQGSTL